MAAAQKKKSMSARRIGWNVSHPTKWVNDLGWSVDLLQTSPRMLKWHTGESLRRRLGAEMAQRWDDPSLEQEVPLASGHAAATATQFQQKEYPSAGPSAEQVVI